jgi:hypothetical protein
MPAQSRAAAHLLAHGLAALGVRGAQQRLARVLLQQLARVVARPLLHAAHRKTPALLLRQVDG